MKNKVETHTIHYSDVKSNSINLEKCGKEFKNIYGPSSVCNQVDLIKSELLIQKNNRKLIFLNMSELTPFYSIFIFTHLKFTTLV